MYVCMYVCMHVYIGATMLSKAAAYDSETWSNFQNLNVQVQYVLYKMCSL